MSVTTTDNSNVIEYNGVNIDIDGLPAASRLAMIRRGLNHYFGNEAASKMAGWKEAEANVPDSVKSKGKDAVKAFVMAWASENVAKIEAQEKVIFDGQLNALLEGTVGAGHARGPRMTPIETLVRQFATQDVKTLLGKNGLSVPKKDQKVAFGSGESFTMDELVDRNIARQGDALRARANAELKSRERNAAKLLEAAKTAGAQGAEALGL